MKERLVNDPRVNEMMRFYLFIIFSALLFSCNGDASGGPSVSGNETASSIPVAGYDVIKVYKHDRNAFTQGLFFDGGFLYESTGQYGQSSLRKVAFETGEVIRMHSLPQDLFAEGIALLNGKIYQLTWQSGMGFVYDANNFKILDDFRYSGEGWGLTTDGTSLYQSDGTHVIRVVNPESFETLRTIVVNNDDGRPLMNLNELEWVKGEIWANIWHSEKIGKPNHIARIDPNTGRLLGWINLEGISPGDSGRNNENTLNGIAYDPDGDRIFVTGKNWTKLFEIKLKSMK